MRNADATTKPVYTVRVIDRWCGVRGHYVEECETTDKREADHWFAQWKSEYPKDEGFILTRTTT